MFHPQCETLKFQIHTKQQAKFIALYTLIFIFFDSNTLFKNNVTDTLSCMIARKQHCLRSRPKKRTAAIEFFSSKDDITGVMQKVTTHPKITRR
jgi:hypothetical protein